jgi:hypothetical protein
MQQFKISEAGHKKARKRMFTVVIPMLVIVLIVVILINTIGNNTPYDSSTLSFTLPMLLVVFGYSLFRTFKKQNKFLQSYTLTISEEGITREQQNTPPLFISFMEIKEIVKTKKGGFIIKGLTRTDVIYISYFIENPQVLEERLQAMAPITTKSVDPTYRKYLPLLVFPAIGLYICVLTLTNKILVGISCVLFVTLSLWGFFELQRNKNIPTSSKRASWFLLLFLASLIYMTVQKLIAS